ncbi:MAG: 3-dehydroquinate synthase [Pseudanabaenaceae cyanobacterium bins.68]|nr:3-dehydroquinate synthase [Pseudanabaenaceae cyanobacterium bins.68]
MLQTVELKFAHAPQQNYQIFIQPGSLASLGEAMSKLNLGQKVLVVSNPVIFRHYGDRLCKSLEAANFQPSPVILPAGERYKTATSLHKIYDAALAHRLERSSVIVALGGGVVGDMAGFAAATWLRGINLVQVPTSLLAMVDSAIGGKTGINHPQGKNLIGAFHQPRLVLVDPEVLHTLPSREFRAAMAEVIKYGVIWDQELFQQLEQAPKLDRLGVVAPELLQAILYRSALCKATVVSQDEKEGNLRAILNYGHTVGHAIEAATRYRLVNHGEAVGLGMIAAGEIAQSLGLWGAEDVLRQQQLIAKAALPQQIKASSVHIPQVVAALNADKKISRGRIKFILPTAIGRVTTYDQITPDQIDTIVTPAIGKVMPS